VRGAANNRYPSLPFRYGRLRYTPVVDAQVQGIAAIYQEPLMYPDLKLIMAPTTVGIAAAAKAMQDEKLCDKVKVSGLGLPAEMVSYTLNGCAPQFALWSFRDLGT